MEGELGLIWWGEAPERPTTFCKAAAFARTNGGVGRKSCRAGPRVWYVLEIKRRWDRLGGESVLLTMYVRNRVVLLDFCRPFRSLAPPTTWTPPFIRAFN